MSINKTTLSAAMAVNDLSFIVASTTGITGPSPTSGVGNTLALIDQEMVFVAAVNTTTKVVNGLRGYAGTLAAAHLSGANVIVGLPTDFDNWTPTDLSQSAKAQAFSTVSTPVASAATITASGTLFHVTGTTQMSAMNPPANFTAGKVTIIFDGVATWTTGGATGIAFAVAGTPTTAASYVDFIYDEVTGLWYPSRLA